MRSAHRPAGGRGRGRRSRVDAVVLGRRHRATRVSERDERRAVHAGGDDRRQRGRRHDRRGIGGRDDVLLRAARLRRDVGKRRFQPGVGGAFRQPATGAGDELRGGGYRGRPVDADLDAARRSGPRPGAGQTPDRRLPRGACGCRRRDRVRRHRAVARRSRHRRGRRAVERNGVLLRGLSPRPVWQLERRHRRRAERRHGAPAERRRHAAGRTDGPRRRGSARRRRRGDHPSRGRPIPSRTWRATTSTGRSRPAVPSAGSTAPSSSRRPTGTRG